MSASTGRVVADEHVDRAVGQSRADRIAVALLAQRRHEAHRRIEVADVQVDEVHVVHADVARDRQPFGLGAAHELDAGRAGQAAQVHARMRVAHELEDGGERDRLGDHRHAGEAHAGGQRSLGRHAVAEERVLRTQPRRVAEGAAYCSARCSTSVSFTGTSACEKPTQPASVSSAISVSTSPASPASARRAGTHATG
jgi:hypothetical protein